MMVAGIMELPTTSLDRCHEVRQGFRAAKTRSRQVVESWFSVDMHSLTAICRVGTREGPELGLRGVARGIKPATAAHSPLQAGSQLGASVPSIRTQSRLASGGQALHPESRPNGPHAAHASKIA